MSTNQLLTSSDHHANWEALEKLFQIAKEKNIPFVISGDIIGDYNFDELAKGLDLKYPFEIHNELFKQKLGDELFEQYVLYSQVKQQGGDMSRLLHQVPQHLKEQAKQQIEEIIKRVESEEFQKKFQKLNIEKESESIILGHKLHLRSLYNVIVKTHAKLFAQLIDRYNVETYFLNGNHEPVYFPDLVKESLKNKELFTDLASVQGICNVNGIDIAGVPNVCALMPYLNHLFSKEELDEMFSHQRGKRRPILYNNVSTQTLENSDSHTQDEDWIRIMKSEKKHFDVFFTHGQVGRGSWRDTKHAQEMPTLHVAGMLSYLAKLTVDGHLHTTHEMKNPLEKETIRAVGNCGFILTKENGEITREKIEVDAPYDARGKITFENQDLKSLVAMNVVMKK